MLDRNIKPEVHDIPFLHAPKVETMVLKNGVELVLLDSGVEPVCRITFSWIGGLIESCLPAATELLAQLLKEGSQDIPPEKMADLIDSNGSWIVSEIHPHNLSLTLFAINSTLSNVLPAIIDLINNPIFPKQETDTIKARLAARQRMVEKRVDNQARLLENEILYGPDHPAARESKAEDYLALTPEIVTNTYKTLYQRQPPMVFVTGKLDASVRDALHSNLPKIKSSPERIPKKHLKPFAPQIPGTRRKECPESLQSAIRISVPTIPRTHPDYETLRTVVTALGGYFGSRLMAVIREEKGLTYGISAALLGHQEGAFVTIACQCDNRYTNDVIKETLAVIHRLATEPMDNEELTALKRYATSSIISMFDTPFTMMDYFITQRHSLTPPDYLERQQRAIARLTPELIMDFASKYIDQPEKYISIAGKCANS